MEQTGKSGGASESDSDDEPLIKIAKRPLGQLNSPTTSTVSNSSNNADISRTVSSQSKSLSAYAHFFNDTQQSIRKKDNSATFEEVSQVVKSMWESLDANTKLVYQQKAEEDSKQFRPSIEGELPDQQTEQLAPDTMDARHTNTVTYMIQPVSVETANKPSETVATAEPTAGTSLKSSEKPIIVAKLVNKSQIITLGNSNKIIVRTRPQNPDPAMALNNVKGITIIKKAGATEPVSISAESSQPPTEFLIATVNKDGTIQKVPTAQSAVPACSNISPSASPTISDRSKSPADQQVGERAPSASPPGTKVCKNNGCDKPAVKHKKGDEDFCSSKCIVVHCHERFKAWVAARS